MKSPADILEEVADLYESGEIGWTQHAFRRTRLAHPNSYCLIGSMRHRLLDNQCLSYGLEYEYALNCLRDYIRENGHGLSVDDWNDMFGRTLGEVVDLLKHVAKDLRNKE